MYLSTFCSSNNIENKVYSLKFITETSSNMCKWQLSLIPSRYFAVQIIYLNKVNFTPSFNICLALHKFKALYNYKT